MTEREKEWKRVTLHTRGIHGIYFPVLEEREKKIPFFKHNNSNWIYALPCRSGIPRHRTDSFLKYFRVKYDSAKYSCRPFRVNFFLYLFLISTLVVVVVVWHGMKSRRATLFPVFPVALLLRCWSETLMGNVLLRCRYQFSRLISISHSPGRAFNIHLSIRLLHMINSTPEYIFWNFTFVLSWNISKGIESETFAHQSHRDNTLNRLSSDRHGEV